MNALEQLENEIEVTSFAIYASEIWAQVYHDHPDQHQDLIKMQAKLERQMRSYFRTFASDRARNYVNWPRYQYETIMADDLNPIVNVDQFQGEETTIEMAIVYDTLVQGIVAGATAAEAQAGFQTYVSASTPYILAAARESAGELITKINATTLDQIRESIKTSLAMHEGQTEAISRIQAIIKNPVRAEMIARTESVRSWNEGMFKFANENNAVSVTWQAYPDACKICSDNDGTTVTPGDLFPSGDLYPPAHPNCRCGTYYTYDNGKTSSG